MSIGNFERRNKRLTVCVTSLGQHHFDFQTLRLAPSRVDAVLGGILYLIMPSCRRRSYNETAR